MNVSLTPELEKFVSKQVKTGMYGSASEVMRQALRLLVHQEEVRVRRLEALEQALREGLESGEPEPLDMEAFLASRRGNKA